MLFISEPPDIFGNSKRIHVYNKCKTSSFLGPTESHIPLYISNYQAKRNTKMERTWNIHLQTPGHLIIHEHRLPFLANKRKENRSELDLEQFMELAGVELSDVQM